MPTVGYQPRGLLLRAVSGNRSQPGPDASAGRVASGTPGVWQSPAERAVEATRPGGQSQAGETTVAVDGYRGDLPTAAGHSAGRRARDLPVPAQGIGDQWTEPGLVQRHHVYPDGVWVYVFGGGDGLVEPLCVGVGVEQHDGNGVLHSSVGASADARGASTADFQHRSGTAVHQSRVHRCGAIGRSGSEHGWSRALDGQPVHRAAVAQREV